MGRAGSGLPGRDGGSRLLGTRLSFFGDDWNFLLVRAGLKGSSLFVPHNGQLVVGLDLTFKAVVALFGYSQLPFRLILGLAVAGVGVSVYLLLADRLGWMVTPKDQASGRRRCRRFAGGHGPEELELRTGTTLITNVGPNRLTVLVGRFSPPRAPVPVVHPPAWIRQRPTGAGGWSPPSLATDGSGPIVRGGLCTSWLALRHELLRA